MAAKFCRTSYAKGGVCMYVHKCLEFVSTDIEIYCNEKDFEACAIKLNLNSTSICIITTYRAPSGNFNLFINKLDAILNKLYNPSLDFIICGDINIDYLKNTVKKNQLENLLLTYNLTSTVNFPTRSSKLSATAIDNIFINIDKKNDYTLCPIINGLSDHDAQLITLNTTNLKPPTKYLKTIRSFDENSLNDFLNKLSFEIWDTTFSSEDINTMFNAFLDTYLKIFYSSFPLKKIQLTLKSNEWITLGIRTSCKHKRELYVESKSNPKLRDHYKKYCKILTTVVNEAKRLTYNNKIKQSTNPNKTIWDTVKMETGKINSTMNDKIHKLQFGGKLENDYKKIAEVFNTHFTSIAKTIAANNDPNNCSTKNRKNTMHTHYLSQFSTCTFPILKLTPLSTKNIRNVIKSLKSKNSHGYDEISTKLLKLSAPFILSPLTHICNKSLSSGIFPDRLKYSEIKPLFKKGDKLNISNYRPISVLSSFSKVLEKAVYNQLYDHCRKHNILVGEQFGFRNKLATTDAIYQLINKTLIALNEKIMVGGIFCDLEKAFDSINHDILVSKLKFYGAKGKTMSWFKSYLKNRYQRVTLTNKANSQNYHSTWQEVTHGVPQGSILGPLLFLIYINDLPRSVNDIATPILFADDTTILITSPKKSDFELKVTTSLKLINEWLNTNFLFLNLDKTHFIQSTTKNKSKPHLEITHLNKQISMVSNIKFLGIYINDTLNWKTHIESILPKLSMACYAMRTIKPYMSLESLRIVYHCTFNSVINYGLPFWGISPHCKRIFTIQKRIVRIMLGCRRFASCRNLFKKLKILPFSSQYIFSITMFIVKNKHQFIANSEIHNINTRQLSNFHQSVPNLTVFKHGIYYSGVQIYNNLPSHIKQLLNNPTLFEQELKNFLHFHSFYSLEEYFQYNLNF